MKFGERFLFPDRRGIKNNSTIKRVQITAETGNNEQPATDLCTSIGIPNSIKKNEKKITLTNI